MGTLDLSAGKDIVKRGLDRGAGGLTVLGCNRSRDQETFREGL